jgi:uncharacterized protein YbaA (DUF1428 family)
MSYVDGFVISVPKKNIKAYLAMARKAGRVWREHGALEYYEAIGDDLDLGMGMPFPKLLKNRRGETVVFSWILYRSRTHRDKVNGKVMKDARMTRMMNAPMPFDMKRFSYGGFKVAVER